MTTAYHAAPGVESRDEEGVATARGMTEWLCLAAAPTFAIMALMTSVSGGGPMDGLCSAGHGSALSGMVPMYLLMSAFHAGPWLKLFASRRGGGAHANRATLVTPGA
jgi:hypothetical protein